MRDLIGLATLAVAGIVVYSLFKKARLAQLATPAGGQAIVSGAQQLPVVDAARASFLESFTPILAVGPKG
jgi:hypothetical protein